MTDIIDRLKEACNGHPAAKIPWPHRLLHDAISEIERLRGVVDDLCRESDPPRLLAKALPCKHQWGEPFDGAVKCTKCGTPLSSQHLSQGGIDEH